MVTRSQNQGMLNHPGAISMSLLHGWTCNLSTICPRWLLVGRHMGPDPPKVDWGHLLSRLVDLELVRPRCSLLLNLVANRSTLGWCHREYIAWRPWMEEPFCLNHSDLTLPSFRLNWWPTKSKACSRSSSNFPWYHSKLTPDTELLENVYVETGLVGTVTDQPVVLVDCGT